MNSSSRFGRFQIRVMLVIAIVLVIPGFILTYIPWRMYKELTRQPSDQGLLPATVRNEMRAIGRFLKDWPRAFRSGTQLRGI